MPFFGRSPKANKDYEAFKKNYTTASFKSEFTKLFNAAIADILKFNKLTTKGTFNFESQEALVEYYVNAKLVDTEILTKIVFNKLNEFIKIPDTDPNHALIKTLDLETLRQEDPEGKLLGERNEAMTSVFNDKFKWEELSNNLYFVRLLVLLLTIRYYPYTIVETIFQNGKNNIESIINNISVMNGHTADIQKIVDTIDPPPVADAVVDNGAVDAVVDSPNAAPASNGIFGAFSNLFGTQGGGQVGGTNDVVSILETINRAQLVNDPAISQLVKYSTNILCNALTLLSVSISFPSKGDALLAIMPQLHANINKYFIPFAIDKQIPKNPSVSALKEQLNTLIMHDRYSNIITNISEIHKTIRDVVSDPVVVAAPRPRTGTIGQGAANSFINDIINRELVTQSDEVKNNAKQVGLERISIYLNKKSGIDQLYSIDVANAIASVYNKYSISYQLTDVAEAAKIAADNAYENKSYDIAVSAFLNTKIPKPTMVGGALLDDFNFETNLQASIIKGIESSTFFRLSNDSASVSGAVKGGQRTQRNRNRNRNRGGTRKNINSNNYEL